MQVFRLVQSGQVDKLIAFEDLPKRLLDGVEMRGPEGLPRHWKAFIGEHERVIAPTPEKNPLTGKVEMVGGVRETGPFFFVLNYMEINKDKERWQEICGFVRRVVSLQFRLLDKLEDMALPMAPDAMAELKLEPEDLEANGAIIPIPEQFQEKSPAILDKNGKEVRPELPAEVPAFKCVECDKTFNNERGLMTHNFRMHKKEPATA